MYVIHALARLCICSEWICKQCATQWASNATATRYKIEKHFTVVNQNPNWVATECREPSSHSEKGVTRRATTGETRAAICVFVSCLFHSLHCLSLFSLLAVLRHRGYELLRLCVCSGISRCEYTIKNNALYDGGIVYLPYQFEIYWIYRIRIYLDCFCCYCRGRQSKFWNDCCYWSHFKSCFFVMVAVLL